MTTSQKQRKFSLLLSKLITWTYANGYEIVLGEVFRTKDQQKLYVAAGKSKTVSSMHLRCLAADINLFKNDKYLMDTLDYKPIGDYWKSLDPDCVWGGDWGWDGGHFQFTK